MKATIEARDDLYVLHISAESDVEGIALRAWSERYYIDAIQRDDAKAALLLSFTPSAAAGPDHRADARAGDAVTVP